MRAGLLLPFLLIVGVVNVAGQSPLPQGNVAAGQTAWGLAARCQNCHGAQAEGGFGPDLAGRELSAEQFSRAVRIPWGVMPAYTEGQLDNQTLADMFAYVKSLPKVAQLGRPTVTAPPGAPIGQVYLVDSVGCAQCHGPELRNPRRTVGGEGLDFEHFAKLVYAHTDAFPKGRMGNYSKLRLPEPVLREIFRFAKDDLGLLVPITAAVDAGTVAGGNRTYTVTVRNGGVKGKGLTAEDLTLNLMLPAGAKIVSTTGDGYQGIRPDTQGNGTTTGDAAVWKLSRLAPTEEQKYTVTMAGDSAVPGIFKDSTVVWTKPATRPGVPDLALREPRAARKDDYIPLALPPASPPPPAAAPAVR